MNRPQKQEALVQARYPTRHPPWTRLGDLPVEHEVLDASAWQQGLVRVVSSVDFGKMWPQWHLAVYITENPRRPSAVEMLRVRRAFGMLSAEERDQPGMARHLFLSIDRGQRVDHKKPQDVSIDEAIVNAITGECMGCQLQRESGWKCPLHRGGKE